MHKLKIMFIIIVVTGALGMGVIKAKPVQAVTFDFNWKGNAGYSAQGSFSYDETKGNPVVTNSNLDFLKISFFDQTNNLLKNYVSFEKGKNTGIDPYLEFNFNPLTQSLFGAFDVGEGNLIGDHDFYLHGIINSTLELRNLDTNVLDSNLGAINVENTLATHLPAPPES